MSTSTTTHPRSNSQTRRIPSRPTTPLRPSSRTSLRSSTTPLGPHHTSYSPSSSQHPTNNRSSPLLALEPSLADLADSMADLEANFMHLQLMHESLSRFSESFASFLYGLNMNAFCVDFPEAPGTESFKRQRHRQKNASQGQEGDDVDATITLGSGIGGGGPVTPKRGGVKRGGYDADSTFLTQATSDASFATTATELATPRVGRSSRSGGSRLRTPARKSGIARGFGEGGRGRGTVGSTGNARGGGSVRGSRVGRGNGVGRGRGRGVS
ncbi:DASH complex subunit dam1 [Thelotrema lepadinum]|nr:DASH complex subunit dam1 [Thelotrema lepadinum]